MAKNMNAEARMAALKAAGIDSTDFIVGLGKMAPGTKVEIIIGADGKPQIVTALGDKVEVDAEDSVLNEIIKNGYVRNTKLHRRWITAQMFRMLNYKRSEYVINGKTCYYLPYGVTAGSFGVREVVRAQGYTDYLNERIGYEYTFDMMLEEIRVLSKLQVADPATFEERAHFFNQEVVIQVCEDFLEEFKKDVSKRKVKHCKKVPYVSVGGKNVFVEDLDKKVFTPIKKDINRMYRARNYGELYYLLRNFIQTHVQAARLSWKTKKSASWVDAYKGNGAFYTLRNLVLFHDCELPVYETGDILVGVAANKYLIELLDTYADCGYKFLALLRATVKHNNFDLAKSIEAHK